MTPPTTGVGASAECAGRRSPVNRRTVLAYTVLCLALAASVATWAGGIGRDRQAWIGIASGLKQWGDRPLAFVYLLLAYYVASLACLPGLVMMAIAVSCLGRERGAALCICGTLASAGTVHQLARLLGRDYLLELWPESMRRAEQLLGRGSFVRVLQLRLMPVIPFHIVNAVTGLSGIPLSTFLAGSFVGVLPRMFVEVGFVHALISGLVAPGEVMRANIRLSGLLFLVVTTASFGLERVLRRQGPDEAPPAG